MKKKTEGEDWEESFFNQHNDMPVIVVVAAGSTPEYGHLI
jgi:hypothetical protein